VKVDLEIPWTLGDKPEGIVGLKTQAFIRQITTSTSGHIVLSLLVIKETIQEV
jgi:hypothetical protein